MFTGLIQKKARVESLTGSRLSISCELHSSIEIGQSIAVNGICLSAIQLSNARGKSGFCADISPETFERTSLKYWKEGLELNIELPLQATSFLGGHFVQGHIDGIGTIIALEIIALEKQDSFVAMTIATPPSLEDFFIEKGSVAIDGVSLTINAFSKNELQVMLIPETLRQTRFGNASVGDKVNIEADMMTKTIVHHLQRMKLERLTPCQA